MRNFDLLWEDCALSHIRFLGDLHCIYSYDKRERAWSKVKKKNEKTEQKTLARWIIDKINKDTYRAGTLKGSKHPEVDEELINAVGGRKNLVEQARYLEYNTEAGKTGKLWFDWTAVNTDIKKINCEASVIPELCKLEHMEDPRDRQLRLVRTVKNYQKEVKEYDWLCHYYDDILQKLEAGKTEKDAYEEDEFRFPCINAIAKLEEPVWERVFSRRVFGDSKKFEKQYRSKMYTILKNYSPYYEEELDPDEEEPETREQSEQETIKREKKKNREREVLQIHGILSYAQTIEWKGPLTYLLQTEESGEKLIGTSCNIFGTVLNTQTLEHAVPVDISSCKKIMTIENKANYESMPYEEQTLYLFCHGNFTSKEVTFLQKIREIAPPDCEYYHWSDMDLGGISIFQSIKDRIFPELKPYKMSAADFREAIQNGAGIPLKASSREKLMAKNAGLLEDLKQEILKTGQTVEQEYFL